MFKKSRKIKTDDKLADIKFCKDCIHCDDSEEGNPVCKSTVRRKNQITGKPIRIECWLARGDINSCGSEAKWFEPKPAWTFTQGSIIYTK